MAVLTFKQQLFKAALLAKHPNRPPRRLPRLLHPDPMIFKYQRELWSICDFIRDKIEIGILPKIEEVTATFARERKDADLPDDDYFAIYRNDLSTLTEKLDAIKIQTSEEFTPDEIRRMARAAGESVEKWNKKQLTGQIKAVAEIDVFGSEPWLEREMGAFVVQNASLIHSIGDDYIDQVKQLLATSIRSGLRVEEIANDIQDRYDVSKSHANLIARDQVGKFNGQLTELRQKDLGIDEYTRRGVGDARERDSHRLLNNEVFSWDDPPEVGHPGEDYQCRCWAEPKLAKFYDDAS